MKTTASIVASVLLSLGLLGAPAHADPPRNVHDGLSGTVEAGWVRAACATRDDAVKCAIRFPVAFARVAVSDYVGRKYMGTLAVRDTAGPTERVEKLLSLNRRIIPGVRLACGARGGAADCDLIFARRRDYSVTIYVAGEYCVGWSATTPAKERARLR